MVKFAQMPKYEAYKDSGVEWLGDIPAEWSLIRLKNTMESCVNGLWGDDPKGKDEIVVLRVADFDYEKLSILDYKLTYRAIPEKDRQSRLLKNGDLLIEKSGGGDKTLVGRVVAFNKEYQALTSNFVAKISPQTWVDSSFLKYVFATLYSNNINYLSIKQTTGIQNLDTSSYFNEFFCFPIKSEQALIANYLDQKTAQIDAAIAIKEQQIELLKERKQIIIQQAVTQGLDPNVPMKDSGVEWIGQIPEHWEIKRIKHVTSKIGSGVTPSGGGSTYLDEGIPLLRSQNIHFDRIDLTDVARISRKTYQDMSNSQVKKGDVLLNITGGSIGRCYFVDTDEDMNVNQHVCIVRPMKNIETVFLNAFLASEVGQGQIWFFQQGGGREGLNFQALKNFSLALPPTAEQKKIVFFIEKESAELNELIELQRKQIQKLKEYKSTLINSAVTGKIKITPDMLQA